MSKQWSFGLVITGMLVTVSVLGTVGVRGIVHSSQHVHQHDPHSGAIAGRVLDAEGQPVSGAKVRARKANFTKGKVLSVITDKEGRFLIKDLTPGLYTVYASKEEDSYPETLSAFHSVGFVDAPQVDVYEQQVTSDVIARLGPKAAKLVAHIVDAITNRPIKHARITLRRVDNHDYMYSTSTYGKVKGVFELLVPRMSFTIEVSAPGYEDWGYKKDDARKQADALQSAPEALQLVSDDIKHLTVSLRPVQ